MWASFSQAQGSASQALQLAIRLIRMAGLGRPHEQPVLATDRDRLHRPFGGVVIDIQFPVFQIAVRDRSAQPPTGREDEGLGRSSSTLLENRWRVRLACGFESHGIRACTNNGGSWSNRRTPESQAGVPTQHSADR